MDAVSQQKNPSQIYPQVDFLEPNLYYTPFIPSKNMIPFKSQNPPQIPTNKNSKKINTLEISLITLLNAISEYNESNINSEKTEKSDELNKEENFNIMELLTQKTKRNQKYCDACPHHNAPHYAKGMCSNCYHSRGRQKKPWNCPHSNKFHYALGLCQNCYQMRYMKKIGDDGCKIQENSGGNTNENIVEESIANTGQKKVKKGPGRHAKKNK